MILASKTAIRGIKNSCLSSHRSDAMRRCPASLNSSLTFRSESAILDIERGSSFVFGRKPRGCTRSIRCLRGALFIFGAYTDSILPGLHTGSQLLDNRNCIGYTENVGCTARRFGRIDRGSFICHRGKAHFFIHSQIHKTGPPRLIAAALYVFQIQMYFSSNALALRISSTCFSPLISRSMVSAPV